MTYHVIKHVKGRQYLYKQTSRRKGKTVLTESEYIGAVDPVAKKLIKSSVKDPEYLEKYRRVINDRIISAISKETIIKGTANPKDIPEAGGNPRELKIKINCERFAISKYSLEQDWRKNRERLKRIGVFPEKFPRVSVEYGKEVRTYKRLFSGVRVVTIPKYSKKKREKLRHEYRRALSLASLEALEKECPDLFQPLSLRFQPHFQKTQTLLQDYLLATNYRNAHIRSIMLKRFGNMPEIAGGNLKPQLIGLVDYGKRKDWQDEAASLMAAIQGRGWGAMISESTAELYKAKAALEYVEQDTSQWGKRKKKAIKRAKIRIRLNELKGEKLKILRDVFGY